MKRLIAAIAVLLGWAVAAWSAPPATLTLLRQITALSNAQASQNLPVSFEATVTIFVPDNSTLFVQDDGAAIYVHPLAGAKLVAGDRVLIQGKTGGSFHPIVLSDKITLLRHGALPKATPATFDELIRAQFDALLVTVRGVVRAVDRETNSSENTTDIQLAVEGGTILAFVAGDKTGALEDLLDDEVEITGVCAGQFDGKMQMHGVQLNVNSPGDVRIIRRGISSVWSLPVTDMDKVITSYHVTDHTQRVRVHGTITYFEPFVAVVLQDGPKSLWINTKTSDSLKVGDVVDATGFPEAHTGFLALSSGEIQDSHVQAPITPLAITRSEVALSRHVIDLVSVEGRVVSAARGASQDEYGLTADGQLFSAVYRHHSGENAELPPMPQIPLGVRVRVTGICITEDTNPFSGQVPFDILMRSLDDIQVVQGPPLLSTRNLILLVGFLLVVIAAIGGWGWRLERKLHRHTAAVAAVEQIRGSILEDINGSRPLVEILEKIVGMTSEALEGVPCWCELADGSAVGDVPPQPHNLQVVRMRIDGRSGPALGSLFAALGAQSLPPAARKKALTDGVRLTSLAIETRRLYSDLRRRSEFDLLTDIPNRFAMDKRLNLLIEEASHNGSVFGLIYIDLDKFKPINDRYGHHIGDLYLQEAAVRMMRQLRGGDMLARLGGDEFAALVSVAHSREDVVEAAHRLERCFEEPFAVGEYSLRGTASFGIALYPADGASKDSLLSAADAAMYAVKNLKKQLQIFSG